MTETLAKSPIRLADIPTRSPEDLKRKDVEALTQANVTRLGELHHLLQAEGKHSVLIVLQGMDASGKDGAVANIFRLCSHNNFRTYSFKKPTEEEFARDFLWRVHKQCPGKGEIMVFNRSHYEDVLIQRVHKWISEEHVHQRMQAINAFEQLLQFDANTHIFKFYLHISKEQQALELQERLDEREKHYKHNDNDWREREYWDEYRRCYEYCINESVVPWHIIPVDQRWYRDYLISSVLVEALEKLDMQFPDLPKR